MVKEIDNQKQKDKPRRLMDSIRGLLPYFFDQEIGAGFVSILNGDSYLSVDRRNLMQHNQRGRLDVIKLGTTCPPRPRSKSRGELDTEGSEPQQ